MSLFQMDANPRKELNDAEDFHKFALSTYRNALEFYHASVYLLPTVVDCTIPIITNAAFSCELFLKAILTYTAKINNKKQLNEHNLYNLYLRIDDDEIEERIKQKTGEKEFLTVIKEVGEAFKVIRYVHEYTEMTCDVEFLYKFMNALHEECLSLMRSELHLIDR